VAENKVSHIAWIWGIWRERGGLIALLFLLTLLSSAVAVTYPYMTKLLFDTLQRLLERPAGAGAPDMSAGLAEIRRLALVVIGVGLAGFVANFFRHLRLRRARALLRPRH
jgi:hypothetical protein